MENRSEQAIAISTNASARELGVRERFVETFRRCPIPDNELLANIGLFLNRQALSRILFFHDLYQKILNVHGVIMEFGVRWGKTLALLEGLRGIYEPYNYTRKIIGFDTFSGFTSVHEKDGASDFVSEKGFSVTSDYEAYLAEVMDYHEQESPLSHMKKYELVKGDASVTIRKYLDDNPETIIAFAYFDFDLYEPTRACLEAIQGHLTKGSVLGFDELNFHEFPGETLALKEVLGLSTYRIMRSPLNPQPAYIVIE